MTFTLDGTTVRTTAEGRIYWSDGWERMHQLEDMGYLRHEHYGPATYGHVDYFVKSLALLGAIQRSRYAHALPNA